MFEQQSAGSTILRTLPHNNKVAPRTITLSQTTLTQVHGMLIQAVLRARLQLANATTCTERELYEADLVDCTNALDEFTQAVRGR